MTLLDTELIGKKLVKHGFYRSIKDHQNYRLPKVEGTIEVQFKRFGSVWFALIRHEIDSHTKVGFDGYQDTFTPEDLVEEHKKLQAIFKFLRG